LFLAVAMGVAVVGVAASVASTNAATVKSMSHK
jgi:hypothetical protein